MLGHFKRAAIHAARHGATRTAVAARIVERASQTGEAVQKHHDIAASLHHALGALDGKLSERQVAVKIFVIARGKDMRRNIATEIRHFFGALINEQGNELNFRVIMLDSKGDVLQENGLASLGWSNDQAAGTESDRAEHVDEPACWWTATMLK